MLGPWGPNGHHDYGIGAGAGAQHFMDLHDRPDGRSPEYNCCTLTVTVQTIHHFCQRGNRAKKRGCLGGRIITPRNVGKSSQILRNPLKFVF